ncbi:MAG TPA: winged helix-turn-helix domain-containing protein [Pyrinomonadaceae bacterium]|jgi:TolB-like protein
MNEPNKPHYAFGPFILDTAEQLLWRDGNLLPRLRPKTAETLLILIENSGHTVERDTFIEKLWPETDVEPNNLAVCIAELRKALGEPGDVREYIETVPRRGYRFTASVREVQVESGRTHANVDGHARGTPIDSLAVLPFANLSDNPELEWLSDGIAETLINNLSQLPPLRVMARTTVFHYKGHPNPLQAGREMGVRAIVVGSVRQYSEHLRIGVELIDVADGSQIWGEQYTRERADIFAVESEIASKILENLRLKLSGEVEALLARRHPESAVAYEAYLKGRFYWNKRTVEDIRKGQKYFNEAIESDEKYALAYAGLADSYLLLGSVENGALDSTEAMRLAKESAVAALALDPLLAEAHASLAYVKIFDWDWTEAEREYRRAIELKPSYATAYHWYALYLTAMGQSDSGLSMIKRAREIEPMSLPIMIGLGFYYYLTRQYERAVDEYRKALEIDASFYMAHFCVGMARVMESRFAEALEEYGIALRLSGGSPLLGAGIAHAYALQGRRKEVETVIRELKAQSGQQSFSPYCLAAIFSALGERDEAFRYLREACEARSEGLFWVKVDPMLDDLRADPRFDEILRRVRLAPAE